LSFALLFRIVAKEITFYEYVIIFSYRVSLREKHSYFYAGFWLSLSTLSIWILSFSKIQIGEKKNGIQ